MEFFSRINLPVFRGFTLALIGVTVYSSIAQAQTTRQTPEKPAQNSRGPYTPPLTDNREDNSEENPASFERFDAQTTRQSTTSTLAPKIRFVQPKLASNDVTFLGRRRGAASRGQCSAAIDQPLTALVPSRPKTLSENNSGDDPALDEEESILGLTASRTPSLWFYNPYSAKFPVEFVLQDEEHNYIYKTSLAASQTQPGIVKVSLPTTVSLKVGRKYQWYFLVNCDRKPAFVKGWIEPVALNPNLVKQLEKAKPQQRVALYAANGIWHDALTTLAELRANQPKDATLLKNWAGLLNSADLGAIATEPISKSNVLPAPAGRKNLSKVGQPLYIPSTDRHPPATTEAGTATLDKIRAGLEPHKTNASRF